MQGELYYANGDMFRGEWVQDRASGYGVLMYANNNRCAPTLTACPPPCSACCPPRPPSHAALRVRALVLSSPPQHRLRYEGQWLDDRRHGQGSFYHADGSRYEGEWASGRKEGKGSLFFNNGDSFTGYWSEGAISGPGMLALHEESPWNVADL